MIDAQFHDAQHEPALQRLHHRECFLHLRGPAGRSSLTPDFRLSIAVNTYSAPGESLDPDQL